MSTCVRAQILFDDDNAKWFGDLCRRTFGLCHEGQPCQPITEAARILLVSSQRGLPVWPSSTPARSSTTGESDASSESNASRASRASGTPKPGTEV